MEYIIEEVREGLKNCIDEKTLKTSQKFFKEKIKCYGVRVPFIQKISKDFFKLIKSKGEFKSQMQLFGLTYNLVSRS